jgi:Uma2 family endonuclease
MSAIRPPLLSAQEYLERERLAEYRSEFYRGETFAMAGGTPRHSLIGSNTLGEIHFRLKGRPCTAYNSDLRILIAATGLYTYPDISVMCSELQFADARRDTVLNPTLIVEVLSESTEAYDRGKKFEHYRKIPSLREYILVSQDSPTLERFLRNPDDTWTLTVITGFDQSLDLVTIGVTLPLAAVYDRLDFPPPESANTVAPRPGPTASHGSAP